MIDLDKVNAQYKDVPCKHCASKSLRVELRLEAKPLGTWSLSGAQMKTVASEWPWMVCDNCHRESRGSYG